jgi:hypothetical protein
MISLNEYKNHLIEQYHYEADNTPTKREERRMILKRRNR